MPNRFASRSAREVAHRTLGTGPPADLDAALDALAEFRADLSPVDAVALVRQGRDRFEARGA